MLFRSERMNILHLSDLHMFDRQTFIPKFLKRVAEEEQIDLVASTGDNLGDEDAAPLLLEALSPLLSKPGVFVLGSNDYYSPDMKAWTSYLNPDHHKRAAKTADGKEPDLPWFQMVQEFIDSGWVDLTNQAENLEVPVGSHTSLISAVGVDDPHIMRDHMPEPTEEWFEGVGLRLALTHSPYMRVLEGYADLGADLILAGHTHGGQVRVPLFGAIANNTDIPRKYSKGMHTWQIWRQGASPKLHVSAGLGTSKYAPIRFSCRTEASATPVIGSG